MDANRLKALLEQVRTGEVTPALYNHPESLEEMARHFVYRVLKHVGLPQKGAYVWKPEETGN